MNLSLYEQIVYSTIRIECIYANGMAGTGTGFICKFYEDLKADTFIPVVITNKHVISGAVSGKLIFTKASEKNEPLDKEHYHMDFVNFAEGWIPHPEQSVDLCAMPIAQYIIKSGIKLFFIPLQMSLIPSLQQLAQLSALEEIIMIGYPNGLWDKINNKPIIRRGITATNINFDYNGRKEFVIDAACFPGSSGSPIMILNQGGFMDKEGGLHIGSDRALLLGVLYAGPQYTATGEIKVVDIPSVDVPVAISRIPNNLGYVIKSERIKELENIVIARYKKSI